MSGIIVKIQKLEHYDEKYPLPQYESVGASGADIRVHLKDQEITIEPWARMALPTGLKLEIPKNYEIQIRPRSGLSLKTSLAIVNSPGTIDYDYRGELKIIVANLGPKPLVIEHGQRIAQLVLAPVVKASYHEVKILTDTIRGEGGLGHSGNF